MMVVSFLLMLENFVNWFMRLLLLLILLFRFYLSDSFYTHSFICSFNRSSVQPFNRSFVHSFICFRMKVGFLIHVGWKFNLSARLINIGGLFQIIHVRPLISLFIFVHLQDEM